MAKITVRQNGPLLVEGDDVTVVDWNGKGTGRRSGRSGCAAAARPRASRSATAATRRVGFAAAEEAVPGSPTARRRRAGDDGQHCDAAGPGAGGRPSLLRRRPAVRRVRCGSRGRRRQRGRRPRRRRAPSILLVTLDTTRADAIGPEAVGIQTPAFNALAARGRRFRQAYATVPETLPSHVSMMTGLYPAGPRHPRERPVRAAGPGPAGGAPARGRLPDRGVRVVVHPDAAVRPRARVRRVRRRSSGAGQVERDAARDDRRGAGLPGGPAGGAAVPLGALLRPARSVHAAGAVPQRGSRRARTSGKSPTWTQQLGAAAPGLRAAGDGAGRRHPRRRPRRRAWATTARRCTATCCTSRRCTCRWR